MSDWPASQRTAASVLRWVLLLLLAAPVLTLAWSLYVQGGLFFWDARSIPCGIQSVLQTGNPNAYLPPSYNPNPDPSLSFQGDCAGYPFQYMLPPAVTGLLVGFTQVFGLDLLNGAYFILYALAIGLLGWGARRYGARGMELPLFAFLIACGVFVYDIGGGNITIVFVGLLIGLIAAGAHNRHWVTCTVLLCAAASAFKPLYALYLFIPLFAAGAWLAVTAAGAAITVGYAVDAVLQAARFDQWLNLIFPVVYRQPHFGLMYLMEWLGFGTGNWLVLAGGYVLWCMVIAGLLWSARERLPDAQDRALAALLATTLMLPRIKEYDAIVLIPLFFWLRAWLPERRRVLFQRLALAQAFVLPALWWWVRKIELLAAVADPTITQIADPKWHMSSQGFFLTGLLLLMFGFLVWPDHSGSHQTPETKQRQEEERGDGQHADMHAGHAAQGLRG
jgi:hypothetical protein